MFVVMLSMSFVSCSDDDDDSNTSVRWSSIVGTWTRDTKADGAVSTITFGSGGNGKVSITEYDEETGEKLNNTSENFEYAYDSV